MLNDIARVFSSQGVLIPGSEAVPVSGRQAGTRSACDHKGPDCGCFGPKFEQAAAKLEISALGRRLQAGSADQQEGESGSGKETASRAGDAGEAESPEGGGAESGGETPAAAKGKGSDGKPLTAEEEKQVRELQKRDREVKAHEAAHQAAAGGQARGGASFEYQAGPDGKNYAVGGHVDIDVSPVQGNPRATLAKAMTAQRAALAPADPSGQDRSVAASAAQMALQAQKELAQGKGGEEAGPGGAPGAAGESGDSGPAAAGRQELGANLRGYRRQPSMGAALSVYA